MLMYDIAKKARADNRAKATRLAAPSGQRVDASTWTPAEPLNADVKTGLRPISPRAFKKGGKVSGEACAPRADRKARKSGGRIGKEIINRDVRAANSEREDSGKHIGGYKKGGRTHKAIGGGKTYDSNLDAGSGIVTEEKTPVLIKNPPLPPRRPGDIGAPKNHDPVIQGSGDVLERKRGGKADHPDVAADKALIRKMVKSSARTGKCEGGKAPSDFSKKNPGGTRPTGGRMARKAGGRTGKGKTDVNIVIATGHRAGAPMTPPPGPLPAGAPPVPGLGAAGAMGRAGAMPGAAPAMPVPMPMPMPSPGGAPMMRKAGGRVYRSYKDMDAGAGSGLGRMEKTEIEERRSRRKG
jgi:hypothetical protein